MAAAAIGIGAALAVFLAVALLVHFTKDRDAERERSARRLRELDGESIALISETDKQQQQWLHDLVSDLGSWLASASLTNTNQLATQLAMAGYSQPSAVRYFSGIRLLLTAALVLTFGFVAGMWGASLPRVLMWGIIGGAAGFVGPSFVLGSRVKARQRAIRNAFPDALDILVLSVEGGVSLNAAISCVTEEIQAVHPVLGREFGIVQREMQFGLPAAEAIRSLAERCGISEIRDLAAALAQSERYGASAAKTLRSYADSARMDRQLWAEEVAQKAAVKIIFPMLLCIFPAMFIVLLGPAAFQMANLFHR